MAGVGARLAARFGASVTAVRAAFVVLAVAGGFGAVVYLAIALAWRTRAVEARPVTVRADVGVALVTIGAVWDLALWWPGVRMEVVVPVGLVAGGVAMGWRSPTDDGAPGIGRRGAARRAVRAVTWRVAGGLVLTIGGLALFLGQRVDVATLRDAGLGLAVAIGGIAVVLGPTLTRVVRSFGAEREQRIRAQERAAVATHLHDSVLQTLTLIQKRADDPAATASLARHQERSLRRWLYGVGADDPDADPRSLRPDDWRGAAERMVGEVEDLHAVAIELVMVGDGPSGPAVSAALAAAREACVNAAKFSGVLHLSVYCEWDGRQFSVFVRDRGKGFDPAAVEPDRRGISDSIVGRMRSVGGTAAVRSALGEGTEVELVVSV